MLRFTWKKVRRLVLPAGGGAQRRQHADLACGGGVGRVREHDHAVVELARLDDVGEVAVDVGLDLRDLGGHRAGLIDDPDDVHRRRRRRRSHRSASVVFSCVRRVVGERDVGDASVAWAARAARAARCVARTARACVARCAAARRSSGTAGARAARRDRAGTSGARDAAAIAAAAGDEEQARDRETGQARGNPTHVPSLYGFGTKSLSALRPTPAHIS